MAGGIAPTLLCEQVENTAAWALEGPTDGDALSWRRALREGRGLESAWTEPEGRLAYLELMLSAHFATVATFVPTDVDTRIRFHAWQECKGREALAAAVAVVDRAARWDASAVSARLVDRGLGAISGHDGEWFSVRAGALGRAIQLGADALVEQLTTAIDEELARQAQTFERACAERGAELDALRAACTIAHNLGDLSRVVDQWAVKGPRAAEIAARYTRLGHEDARAGVRTFLIAGRVNKAVMALENHRFLPLRKPRGLRRHRDLLLPLGPFFDAWGATLARHPALDEGARTEVLAALLDAHESDPSQQGYLRAMAGMHGAVRGGLDELARGLPARQRRAVAGGAVREALHVPRERFEARMANRFRQALADAR
jgi:hypothetical protein